jgi:hypothetical protein
MNSSDLAQLGAFWMMIVVLGCLALVVSVFLYWRIFSKAGFNGAWSLLMLIPLGNILALFYLALAEWPVERRARQAQPPAAYPTQPPAAYPPR